MTRYLGFDPDDMAGALDEIDARFAALGGSPQTATRRHSFDARDGDTFASLLTEDCTIIDSRTAGWGSVDRDEFVDYQRSVVDLAEEAHLWIDHVRERGNVSISAARAFARAAGGSWEIAFVTVGVMDAERRGAPLRDLRARRPGYRASHASRSSSLRTRPSRWQTPRGVPVSAQVRAVTAYSWEEFAATLAPDFEQDDRRSVVGRIAQGPDALALVWYTFTFADMRLDVTPVAIRGDRLVFVRTTATFRDGVSGPAGKSFA